MIERRIFAAKMAAEIKGLKPSRVYLGRNEIQEVKRICQYYCIADVEEGKLKTVMGLTVFEVLEDEHLAAY